MSEQHTSPKKTETINPYLYEHESNFIRIEFQHGLPSEVGINGVTIEDVLDVVINKLSQYQAGPLACGENAEAISSLINAKEAMERRRQRRVLQGVYQTLNPHKERTEDIEEDFSATGA